MKKPTWNCRPHILMPTSYIARVFSRVEVAINGLRCFAKKSFSVQATRHAKGQAGRFASGPTKLH